MNIQIVPATPEDVFQLLELYKKIAEIPDGIIRKLEEINQDYIWDFVSKSLKNGLILLAKHDDLIVGEIHAYTPPLYAFQHILTDLTIGVHPNYQEQGVGKLLFQTFLEKTKESFRHILRIELFVREHNTRNVQFYEGLGFVNEGRQKHKIFQGQGDFETPLHMCWFNPNYAYTK